MTHRMTSCLWVFVEKFQCLIYSLRIVMEHVENGLLMSETKEAVPLPHDSVWNHVRDVICGLEYCMCFHVSMFMTIH